MKRIAVVTATRAEYGLLSPVIKELRKYESDDFEVNLIVTGTHLSDKYGMTVDEINDRIDYRIRIPIKSKSEVDISDNQANTLHKFTVLFASERFDGVLILGDRYEMLAVAIACGNTRTPLFHMCGGDTTEGALDEWIRHSITKISYLHFVTNEDSRRRVIQLGENPVRVFNYGSTSIDNIINNSDMSKEEVLKSLSLPDCRYAVCTYHPVTMDLEDVDEQVNNFVEAIKSFSNLQFIMTKSNADQGGARINELLDKAEKVVCNLHVFSSLGVKRYLSLMRYSEFVIGNSSSGIIEAPAFHIPTVNIGNRQRGRLQSASIINCNSDTKSIVEAMGKALSKEQKRVCEKVVSPYGDGNSGKRIADKIVEVVSHERIDLKKKFFDITSEKGQR